MIKNDVQVYQAYLEQTRSSDNYNTLGIPDQTKWNEKDVQAIIASDSMLWIQNELKKIRIQSKHSFICVCFNLSYNAVKA